MSKIETIKVKTAELSGIALDYAVGLIEDPDNTAVWINYLIEGRFLTAYSFEERYHEKWGLVGPIIDVMMKGHRFFLENDGINSHAAFSRTKHDNFHGLGPTALVATLRCYVASLLGDEIDIPKVLLK